ncbi:hypothetical protein GCM10025859_62120 [Alicyclobacillus fastidiosus]|nr:hypothetical protein GCM10025859_62120 [Alicyclobacillus fastidiosus]
MIGEFMEMIQIKQQKEVFYRYVNKEGNVVSLRAIGTPLIGENGDVEQVLITANVNIIQHEKRPKMISVPM